MSLAHLPSPTLNAQRQLAAARTKASSTLISVDLVWRTTRFRPRTSSSLRRSAVVASRSKRAAELDCLTWMLMPYCSVFIGKLKNRKKVAISEFRGQLSASASSILSFRIYVDLPYQWTLRSSSCLASSITPMSSNS